MLWRCQERDEARAALEAAAAAVPQANGKRSAEEDRDASAAKKVRHRPSCMPQAVMYARFQTAPTRWRTQSTTMECI